MSTVKIDSIKESLVKLREEILGIEAQETAHKGNAMSGINMALDNLGVFRLQVEKEAKEKAEAEVKKLEEANKVVAAAKAKADAEAAKKVTTATDPKAAAPKA